MSSNIRYVVVMINIVIPASEIAQSDWLFTAQDYVVLVSSRHIIRISGHKNDCSIKHYARKLSAARKRTISSVLSSLTECEKENVLQSPQQANLN